MMVSYKKGSDDDGFLKKKWSDDNSFLQKRV